MTAEEYKEANRRLRIKEAKTGFIANFAAYAIVNTILMTVNLLFFPGFIWALFPLAGWGFGLTMHYIFGVRRIEQSLKQDEARVEAYIRK